MIALRILNWALAVATLVVFLALVVQIYRTRPHMPTRRRHARRELSRPRPLRQRHHGRHVRPHPSGQIIPNLPEVTAPCTS